MDHDDDEPVQHQRTNGEPRKPANFSEEMEQMRYGRLEGRVKAMEEKSNRIQCEDIVRQLGYEGFYFDEPEKEVMRFMKMDEGDRQDRVKEIRKKWFGDPSNRDMIAVDNTIPQVGLGNGPPLTGSDQNAIVRYCEENDLDMDNDDDYRKAREVVAKRKYR